MPDSNEKDWRQLCAEAAQEVDSIVDSKGYQADLSTFDRSRALNVVIGSSNGQAAGSASPLTWAQAQELRLLVDLGSNKTVDQPAITTARYVTHGAPAAQIARDVRTVLKRHSRETPRTATVRGAS